MQACNWILYMILSFSLPSSTWFAKILCIFFLPAFHLAFLDDKQHEYNSSTIYECPKRSQDLVAQVDSLAPWRATILNLILSCLQTGSLQVWLKQSHHVSALASLPLQLVVKMDILAACKYLLSIVYIKQSKVCLTMKCKQPLWSVQTSLQFSHTSQSPSLMLSVYSSSTDNCCLSCTSFVVPQWWLGKTMTTTTTTATRSMLRRQRGYQRWSAEELYWRGH